MKNTFEIFSDLTYHKPDYKLSSSDDFNPYMICRWISMISPLYAALINDLYNTKYKSFTDNQMLYDYLKVVLPKKYIKFPKYIKKALKSKAESKDDDFVANKANEMQISKREVRELMKVIPLSKTDLKEKDDIKIYKKS